MPALDWDGHSKMSHNTRLKSKDVRVRLIGYAKLPIVSRDV